MSEPTEPVRIDAHHHLWHYTPGEFGWLEGELAPLRRDFLRSEFLTELRSAGVTGSVAVQARQTEAETEFLLEAAAAPEVLSVVGWMPMQEPAFSSNLQRLRQQAPKLCGLRHVVQAEPPGFLEGDTFNRGTRAVTQCGLVYDLLLHEQQLPEATRYVDRHPEQSFVLDHMAKPRICAGEMEPWASNLRELAQRPNVACKVSGMVTEAGAGWTPEQLRPYYEVALEAFTPARLMVGSDWPVLTAHCSYTEWWAIVGQWIAPLTQAEQAAILGGNTLRTYKLMLHAPLSSRSLTKVSAD